MNVIAKLLLGGILLLSVGMANAQNVHGVLRVVKGDVQIKSAKTGQTSRARIGQEVFPKDVVITAKEARAKIVMVDNNEINVSPESQIEIQHYEYDPNQGKKEVLLNVIYGKVRAKVEQKYDGKTSRFQVKTPSAVAGVRGTDFMTSYNRSSNDSQVVTFRGAVQFGQPGANGAILNAVSVTPGKMALSVGGAPPAPPMAMPKEQFAKMDNDSKAEGGPGAAGVKSDRAPSNDVKGDDDKKQDSDKKPDSDKKQDNGGQKGAANSNGGGDRAPASAAGPNTGGGSTLRPEDTGTNNVPTTISQDKGPQPVIIPQVQPIAAPPQCAVCNQLIQNNNAKLTVHINH